MIETLCFFSPVSFQDKQCLEAERDPTALKPRNRDFVIAKPVIATATSPVRSSSSEHDLIDMDRTTKASLGSTAAPQSESRKLLWILAALVTLPLLGLGAYKLSEYVLLILHQHSLPTDNLRLSDGGNGISSPDMNVAGEQPSANQPTSPNTVKTRSQHVRLGYFDADDEL